MTATSTTPTDAHAVGMTRRGSISTPTAALNSPLAEADPEVAAAVEQELHRQQEHSIGITVNRNAIPNDPRPPMVTSGLRIGTPALATRGFGDAEFAEVADIIAATLVADDIDAVADDLRDRVATLAARFPLYPDLADQEA